MTLSGLRTKKAGIASCAAVLIALAGVSIAQEKAVYLFYMRKDLSQIIKKESKKVVGKKVVVTDELVVIWPEVQKRKNTLNGEEYVVFDTTYFHCAVPTDQMGAHLESIWEDAKKGYEEATKQIEATNEEQRTGKITPSQGADKRRELYWELYRLWSNKPVVTIYGQVDRHEFWGEVRGKGAGVATETVSIVVDKVEKPRKRWYKTLDE